MMILMTVDDDDTNSSDVLEGLRCVLLGLSHPHYIIHMSMAHYTSKGGKTSSAKRARSGTPPSPETNLLPSIRILLDSQWEKIDVRLNLLQETFGQRLKKLEETIVNLKESIEFQSHEAQDMKAKMEVIEEDVKSREKMLQDEIDRLSTYVARENLIYSGIEEKPNEDVKKVLRDLHVNVLKIPPALADNFEYQRLHRLSGKPAGGRPRAIKARFLRYSDRVLVQRHAKNLKGTNIYIAEDLPKRIREARHPQIVALKVTRRMGKLAYFSRTDPVKLFIDNVHMPREQQEAFVRDFENQRGKDVDGKVRKNLPNMRIPTTMAGAGSTTNMTTGIAKLTTEFNEGAAAAATDGEMMKGANVAAEQNLMVL